jgi:hypothetical protein
LHALVALKYCRHRALALKAAVKNTRVGVDAPQMVTRNHNKDMKELEEIH